MVLNNVYNKRKFTITNDKINYLITFLKACPSYDISIVFSNENNRKYISNHECDRIVLAIKYMLKNHSVYDFNVNGVIVPIFDPNLNDDKNLQYTPSPMSDGNKHFLECLIKFLRESKLIEIIK